MKKKIVALVLAVVMCMSMTACGNKQFFDTTYTFDKAIISLPNGEVVEGGVESWTDYEDGDQIQVKIGDTTYIVNNAEINIANNSGVELPSTGGEGTMLMITIGTMIAMAFAVLLITHKKMSIYHD